MKTTKQRFNLVDEAWIPVSDVGLTSLRQVFSDSSYRALGGNPVQKIALTKLLLAICQMAATPENDEAWAAMGVKGMAKRALAYLKEKRDCFWLYGERPFLQMPRILSSIEKRKKSEISGKTKKNDIDKAEESAKPKPIGSGLYPDLASDNSTVLTQDHVERILSDPEKALFVVMLMNLALGGKRIEKDLDPMTAGFIKSSSAKSGPSLGNYVGYLQTFIQGKSLLQTLWLNQFTVENIQHNALWKQGMGKAPWEEMPRGEDCLVARKLKESYMGCLVGMCRFVYLQGDGIFYTEGIQYPSHKEGWREPSISIRETDTRLLWIDPNKRPWRELSSLLAFFQAETQDGFDCQQIRIGMLRAKKENVQLGIWSGGLKVRGTSGDQNVKQDDDFVESLVWLPSNSEIADNGSTWFDQLKTEMEGLDRISKIVYGATLNYYKYQLAVGDKQAAQASNLFWQLCERRFQDLVNACNDYTVAKGYRKNFATYAQKAYDTHCPQDTARQMDAWAKNRPNLAKYLA